MTEGNNNTSAWGSFFWICCLGFKDFWRIVSLVDKLLSWPWIDFLKKFLTDYREMNPKHTSEQWLTSDTLWGKGEGVWGEWHWEKWNLIPYSSLLWEKSLGKVQISFDLGWTSSDEYFPCVSWYTFCCKFGNLMFHDFSMLRSYMSVTSGILTLTAYLGFCFSFSVLYAM